MLCAAEPGTPAPPQPWRGARAHSAPSFPAAHFSAEIFSLAAHSRTDGAPVNPEKPHQGVASKKTAPHQPDIARNSTTALGLSWSWWSGTAPGARVTYDYDAWGNTVNTTGSTPNVYLYRGEQYDADLGLYYLRARYFNPETGRFLTKDPELGHRDDPATLHKYLYADGNPVDFADPSGRGGVAIALPGAAPKGGDMWEYFQLALISLRDATIVAATVYTLDCFAVYEFTSQVGWLVDTPLGPLDKCKSSRPVKCYALEFTIVPASSSPTDKVIPTQLCHYVCDDGTSFTRLAPAKKKCPSPIDKP
jgi:RHS repeat-associated protein